jgi:hypothetical protein
MDARRTRSPSALRDDRAALAILTALCVAACSGEVQDTEEAVRPPDAPATDSVPADSLDAEAAAGPARTTADAEPCLCVERSLSDYYGEADEVLLGRLVATRSSGSDLLLDFELEERPWKPLRTGAGAGDVVTIVTRRSTEACGIEVTPEARYLVFGRVSQGGGMRRAVGCGGSRALPATAMAPRAFDEVPTDSLVARLDALSGLDVQRAIAASAPDASDWDNEALVGLVELPALNVGEVVPVRGLPDAAAPVDRVIESWVDVAASEVDYEVPAAVAVARTEDWHRIRLSDGSFGWVAPLDAGAWTPFEELPVGALAYLTEAWSGHLWPQAGAGVPVRSPREGAQESEEYQARVHESRWLGSTLWFRVDLLSSSPCLADEPEVELSGWVPAYGLEGDPAVWYYARGC